MSLRTRILDWLAGRPPSGGEAMDRHERREAARRRHHESGAQLWTDEDRQLGPGAKRQVSDVTPGLPGDFGSVRTIRDD